MKEVTYQEFQSALDKIATQVYPNEKTVELPKELEEHITFRFDEADPHLYVSNISIVGAQNSYGKTDIRLPEEFPFVTFSNIKSNFNHADEEQGELYFYATTCRSFDMDDCNFLDISVQIKISQQGSGFFYADRSNLHIQNSDFKTLRINHEKRSNKDDHFFITRLSKNNIIEYLLINSYGDADVNGKIYIFKNDISGVMGLNGNSQNIKMGLHGGNIIGTLAVSQVYPSIIYWGHREVIGENIKHSYNSSDYQNREFRPVIASNKDILMEFKQMAIERGDRLQESNINYNIAKCDEMQFHADSSFSQAKVIMYLGRLLSRHGTSWWLPLMWIVAINLFIAFVIFDVMDFYYPSKVMASDYLYVFSNLLNPLSSPLDLILNIDRAFTKGIFPEATLYIYIFTAISKGLYAMCIYEFVRAARRFTLK